MNCFFKILHRGMPLALALLVVGTGCRTIHRPGEIAERTGDEIVVAGKFVHTGTPVVLWLDPGGYDAYRVERRFAPFEESDWETSQEKVKDLTSPARYSLRKGELTPEQIERVRGGGWDLPLLQEVVDQFVIHFDAAGTSRQCFKILHDIRCLSVQFMLDLDGTIYQTLDAKERAWHATTSNTRSVGIEIANMGTFSPKNTNAFPDWYQRDADGRRRITVPPRFGVSGIRTPGFVPRPARNEPVIGNVQGSRLAQYDLTHEQYEALIKLTATLCRVFPKMRCDYPRNAEGRLVTKKLSDEELERYGGVLGHFHIQTDKVDPGPAFDWDRVIEGARRLLRANPPEKQATLMMKR